MLALGPIYGVSLLLMLEIALRLWMLSNLRKTGA